jgi:DNA-binding SARP family transcriptional activator
LILLAALLVNANRRISTAELIRRAWGDDVQEAQLHKRVSAVRELLARIGRSNDLKTHSRFGYELRAATDDVDALLFRRLVADAEKARAQRRTEDEINCLRRALRLWRGPHPLSNVPGDTFRGETAALEQRRKRAAVRLFDVELASGGHERILDELISIASLYPSDRRLCEQLMLAEYQCGHIADAAGAYERYREALAEETGGAPDPLLRSLHFAIAREDEEAIAAAESAIARRASISGVLDLAVPRQLPQPVDLVGRGDQATEMAWLLQHEPRSAVPAVVAISGPAGSGKTMLAVWAARESNDRFPDGQLYAQLKEADGRPVSPHEIQAQFLTALGLVSSSLPAGLAERTAVYRSALGERRILIVLDDADSVNQVLPLLPGSPECAVIVTSRRALSGLQGAHHIEVGDLDEATSVELLARVIGPERVAAEPAAALTLVRLCGCLPLALRIVAAKLESRPHWSIDKMVRRMTDEGRRLDELVLSGVGIRTTLSLSYDSLSSDARRLFLRLGLLGAADFASWVAAPLLDADAESAGDVLDTLVEAHLVEVRVYEDGLPRFRLHDLMRIYALERLAVEEPVAERALSLQRLLGCWLSLATEAHRRIYGGDYAVLHGDAARWRLPADVTDQLLVRPLDWLRSEHAGLVSAVLQAAQVGFDELCWDLAVTLVTLFESEHQADDWRKTHEVALEVTRRAGNLRGEAAVLCSLGNLAVAEPSGDAVRYLELALRLFEKIDDLHGRALAASHLGFADRLAGRYQQALARYHAALAGFRLVGDLGSEVDALTSIALIQLDIGQPDSGEKLLDEAVSVCRSLRAPRIMAQTEHRLGEFFVARGDLDRAERTFRFVLQLVRDVGDRIGEAYALQSLGAVHTSQRQFALAEDALQAAISLSRHLGDNLVLGRGLMAYAEYFLARDDPESAASLIDEATVAFGEFGTAAAWRPRLLVLKARYADPTGATGTAPAGGNVDADG